MKGSECYRSIRDASKFSEKRSSERYESDPRNLPTMVPWTTVPFLSSMVTVSLPSFMRNLLCGITSRGIPVERKVPNQLHREYRGKSGEEGNEEDWHLGRLPAARES